MIIPPAGIESVFPTEVPLVAVSDEVIEAVAALLLAAVEDEQNFKDGTHANDHP